MEEQNNNAFQYGKILPAIPQQKTLSAAGPILSPYYGEYHGEFEESCESPCVRSHYPLEDGHGQSSTSISHHSDHCVFCQAFRKFLDSQPEEVLLTYKRPSTVENIEEVNADLAKPSESGNEKIGGSAEGLASDTEGENEESKGKVGKKQSTSGQTGQQQQSQHTQELTPPHHAQVISATSSKVKTNHKGRAMTVQKSATVARQGKEKKKKQSTND